MFQNQRSQMGMRPAQAMGSPPPMSGQLPNGKPFPGQGSPNGLMPAGPALQPTAQLPQMQSMQIPFDPNQGMQYGQPQGLSPIPYGARGPIPGNMPSLGGNAGLSQIPYGARGPIPTNMPRLGGGSTPPMQANPSFQRAQSMALRRG